MSDPNLTSSAANFDEYDQDQIIGLQLGSDAEYEDVIAQALWPNVVEQWFVIILAGMMVIGVIGNTLVVVVVATNKSMRNALNLVLMNLAIADLLILLFCLPLTVVNDVTKTFWFSAVFCKSVNFINVRSEHVSVCEHHESGVYHLNLAIGNVPVFSGACHSQSLSCTICPT
uniref:G_PROTEIN_RECEP_F1_2 domain-containing protein n=1 Tax=Caenorhabditis japonica TaxID=281687 RepID=A0A8R1DSY4_CAEJA